MISIPIKKPNPNIDNFLNNISGRKKPDKVYFFEHYIDEEVKKEIIEKYFNEKYFPAPFNILDSNNFIEAISTYNSERYKEDCKKYYKQEINLWYKMGYSFVPFFDFSISFSRLFNNQFPSTRDTAIYSRGKRAWAQEGEGLIKTWQDFKKFPWKKVEDIFLMSEYLLNFINKEIKNGMKVMILSGMFEPILEYLLGYEGLFLGIYDKKDLVEAVFNKFGKIVNEYYKIVAPLDVVGLITHADDLGFKTSSMLSINYLRKWIFPWFKKYAKTANKYKKPIFFHSCGNKDAIMEDVIEDIKFDALHSFEDNCCPIIDYKKKYGNRIALLGGIDTDKLVRLEEKFLRSYIRKVLDICTPGGRFALGTSNSFCNYIPIKNFLILLDEGVKYN